MAFPEVSIEGHEEWVELRAMIQPSGNKYFYMHEVRCNGIVAVLPYRVLKNGDIEGLFIAEITPCWGETPVICSLTGGIDKGSTAPLTAIKELEEEVGIVAPIESLIPLGSCYGTKSVDTVYTLFAVDVTRLETTKEPERGIQFMFLPLTSSFYAEVKDPIFHVLVSRLQHTLQTKPVE